MGGSFPGPSYSGGALGNAPLTLEEMKQLQTDYHSLPARELVPYLNALELSGRSEAARNYFSDWDYTLAPDAIPAAIYVAWENEIRNEAHSRFVPAEAREILRSLQLERILQWIREPDSVFGNASNRDAFLQDTFNRLWRL